MILENSGLLTTNALLEKFKFCFSSQLPNYFISEEQSLHHGSTLFGDSCNTGIHFVVLNFKFKKKKIVTYLKAAILENKVKKINQNFNS